VLKRTIFLGVGKLVRKSKIKIDCPRCGKLGTLRLKDKKYNKLVVYHYNRKKYLNNEKSDSTLCYIGSLSKVTESILWDAWKKSNPKKFRSELDKRQIKKILQNLKNIVKSESNKKASVINFDLTEIASLLYGTSQINKYLKQKYDYRRLLWDIHCPHCNRGIIIGAWFSGVLQRKISLDVIKNAKII